MDHIKAGKFEGKDMYLTHYPPHLLSSGTTSTSSDLSHWAGVIDEANLIKEKSTFHRT